MIFLFPLLATAMNPFEEVECPLGTDDYARVFSFSSQNQLGGYDSDLASYAKGEQFRTFAISTCYDSYFSLYGTDFGISLTEEQQEKAKEALEIAKKRLLDPKNPLLWERYEIAADMYRILGYPPEFLAQVYLEASWTVRDSFVGFHAGLNGPQAAQELLDIGPKEFVKPLLPDQKKTLLFNLARVAHRAGYPLIRDQYLSQYGALQNLSDVDKKGLHYVQTLALPKEKYYQEKARTELLKAVENPSTQEPEKRIHTKYILADLNRRLGLWDQAKPLYEDVRSQATDKRLVEMSDFFLLR